MSAAQWAEEVRCQRAQAQERLWHEAQRIATAFIRAGAEHVILFGSVARRTASRGSDIDLAVVSPTVRGQPELGRGYDILLAIRPKAPVNLFVYTPEEWLEVRDRPFIRHEICEKGVELFEC